MAERLRFIAVKKESIYGTAMAYASDFDYLPVVSESIVESQEYIEMQAGVARDLKSKLPGPWKIGGDFNVMMSADMSRLILALCGSDSVTTSSDGGTPKVYKHEFLPKVSFEGFTLYVYPGKSLDNTTIARRFAGVIVKEMALEAPAREVLTAGFTVIGSRSKLYSMLASDFNVTVLSALKPFVFYEGAISGTLTTACIEALRVTHANDIPDDLFCVGSRWYRGDVATGPLNITGEMDLSFASWDFYKKFYGDAAATEPIGEATCPVMEPTLYSLTATYTGLTTGSKVAGFENYLFKVEMPKVLIDTSKANFNERDRIVNGITFTALYDTVIGSSVKYTLVNKKLVP
jgi:hypothetical protein